MPSWQGLRSKEKEKEKEKEKKKDKAPAPLRSAASTQFGLDNAKTAWYKSANMTPPQTESLEKAPGTINPLTREGTFKKRNPAQTAIDLTIQAMLRQGAPVRKIAEALNISASTVNRTKARIRAQRDPGEECPGLLSPRRDELAGKVIDRFLTAGARMKKIRGSDALGAVKLYSDRRWPTKQDQAPGPQSFTAVFIQEARIQLTDPASYTTRGIEPPREKTDAGDHQSNQILEAEFRDG